MKPSLELYPFTVLSVVGEAQRYTGRFEIDGGALFVYERDAAGVARVTAVYAPGHWLRVSRVREETP